MKRAVLVLALFACDKSKAPDKSAPAADKPAATPAEIEQTELQVKKLAFEGYPSWAAANPDKQCPDSIAALGEYINGDPSNDMWKRPLKMFCGENLPPGVKGLGVMSFGPDGKENTADDITSWK